MIIKCNHNNVSFFSLFLCTSLHVHYFIYLIRSNELCNCLFLQVFVYGNNIYYVDSPSSRSAVRLTDSGVEHKIFNGIPDWVYQGTLSLKI